MYWSEESMIRRFVASAALSLGLVSAGCMMHGPLNGQASEEWTKSYTLTAGGEVRIDNTNGKVDIEGVDGSKVEITAEKIARATTDEAARQLLPRINITEDISQNRVSVGTERMGGLMIGASFEVRYHVKVPHSAVINAMTTNGQITLTALTGTVAARTTNGGVKASDLAGGVEARSTNGPVSIALKSLGKEKIYLSTTNGGVTLTVPETARADLSATCTNGGISVTGLKLETTDQNRRHLEGKINGGGTAIELHTTNGPIRVRAQDTQ
jgi:DUF4097 and DUF4098 domain-containing protein YvlB